MRGHKVGDPVRRERGDTEYKKDGKDAIPSDFLAFFRVTHNLGTPCLNSSSVKGKGEQGRGEDG